MHRPRPTGESTRPLRVATTRRARDAWIELRGELDIATISQLRKALLGVDLADVDAIFLDMRQLTFCDVTASKLLIQFDCVAQTSGHETTFVGATPTTRKVLTLLAICGEPTFA